MLLVSPCVILENADTYSKKGVAILGPNFGPLEVISSPQALL